MVVILFDISERSLLLWLFTNLVYLALLLYISWKLVFVVFLLFPAIHSSSAWLVGKIKKTAVFHTHLRKRVSQLIHGIMCNMPLIWVSNQEEPEARRYSRLSLQMIDWEFSMTKKTLLIGPVQDIVNQIGLMLFVCIITFITLKPGHGADLSKYLVFFIVLRKMSGQFGQWNGFMASFARIEPVANEMREVIFSDKDKYYVTSGEREFPGLDQGIEFRGLRFNYVPGISILQDITLSIPGGRVTALVGPTGAGKTTLINLLLRFYECPESSIFIDGRDIREFSIKSLRSRMGLVSQETWLFDDTFRMNLLYGSCREVPEEELMRSVKDARLEELMNRLPEGFETLIGDRGVRLSGGEKQRLSIARAMLRNPEILFLDEATSSLDSKTERAIQQSLADLLKGKTSIVIAHRLSTIKNADQIIVLEHGRAAECGALDQLLARKGKFYEYWEEQKFF
jgi:ABC-type multidrug transport system fused ATPase/permease subunit